METQYMSGNIPEMPLTETLAAASRIDGLDIELALGRISGKQQVLEACIEQTANSINDRLRKMSGLLSAGDLHNFSIEAHGLKNALAGIGAAGHSKLASELELASKDGHAPKCKKEFITFAGMMKQLAAELKTVLPQDKTTSKQKGDGKLLFEAAREAAGYLKVFEADDALACISKLDGYTFGEETDALLDYIGNRIKAYKYDESILLLKSILKGE